jgi:hypothetical protein
MLRKGFVMNWKKQFGHNWELIFGQVLAFSALRLCWEFSSNVTNIGVECKLFFIKKKNTALCGGQRLMYHI